MLRFLNSNQFFVYAIPVVLLMFLLVACGNRDTTSSSGQTDCGGGIFVTSGTMCPNGSSSSSSTPGATVGTSSSGDCPTDFALAATQTCTVPSEGLICSGDINEPSVGFAHDSKASTGEVLQASAGQTLDGGGNGGSCHTPSSAWTPQGLADSEFSTSVVIVNYYIDGKFQNSFSKPASA